MHNGPIEECVLKIASFGLSATFALSHGKSDQDTDQKEQLEKLKRETMGQLNESGNRLLGNFGLSTDNCNAVKHPNTGSYSILCNQYTQENQQRTDIDRSRDIIVQKTTSSVVLYK